MSETQGSDSNKGDNSKLKFGVALLGFTTIGLLVATIVLATKDTSTSSSDSNSSELQKQLDQLSSENTAMQKEMDAGSSSSSELQKQVDQLTTENAAMQKEMDAGKIDYGENPCEGARPPLDNVACLDASFAPGMDTNEMFNTGPQSGVNVTKGYQGKREVDVVPITQPYREKGLCPVNVHWHIGAEHYSVGQYDEKGDGPIDFHEGRQGFQCGFYDENDEKFTKQFKWEHCIGMAVGQTYEVHWPHSTKGACNTPWQYQSPFYDGVFCNLDFETLKTLAPQDIANNVGVQSQTFVVVNDEAYYYPDLFTGMIVDNEDGHGTDIAIYTGSTTGTQRNNEVCSPFSPITWQVDRKCHMISASSFDKMCSQMEQQADTMKDDLYAHGSRERVADEHAANNHQERRAKEGPLEMNHRGLRIKKV